MLRRYAASFAVWTAIGVFFCSQDIARNTYFGDVTPWWRTALSWLVGVWVTAALTPAVLALAERFPLGRKHGLRHAALHVVLSAVFAAIVIVATAAFSSASGVMGPLQPASFRQAFSLELVLSGHNNVVSYWAIVGVAHALRYYRRLRERERQTLRLEAELARAQLAALKMQIQPHFLFNTLNAITTLVRQGRAAEADETLGKLAELLRCVLEDASAPQVPLRRELEYVRLYLAIEQLRYGDRLVVETAAAPGTLDAQVPPLGLQPLVENAVRHGVGKSASPVTIRIAARRVSGALELEVTDDGPGMTGAKSTSGIGLDNTRARIATLYGDAGKLVVGPHEPRGVTVTMVLPYTEAA